MPKKSLSTIFNQLIKKIFSQKFFIGIFLGTKKGKPAIIIHILTFKINILILLSHILLERQFLLSN